MLTAALLVAFASPAGSADPIRVLDQNRDAMFALHAYRAACYTTIRFDGHPGRGRHEFAMLTALKPLSMRYDQWERGALPPAKSLARPRSVPDITFASNGTAEYCQFGPVYRKEPDLTADRLTTILEPWQGFFTKSESISGQLRAEKQSRNRVDIASGGRANFEGVRCDVVRCHYIASYEGTAQEYASTYYIGHADHLVRRLVQHVTFDHKTGFTRDAVVRHIDTHPAIDKAIFTYHPPKGVTLESDIKQPELLPNGTAAPDFAAVDADHQTVHLSDLRGKVVVVDFWASWCGPCVASMPHTEAVAKELADAGMPVVVLAVDDGEPPAAFGDWVASHRAKYPHIRFAYADPKAGVSDKQFNVSGIPTQYVIDRQGIIRASFVGYGGPTDDLKNAVTAAAK